MFVFEMFGPSLIMRLRHVCLCLFVHVLTRSYFFSPVMNPDGKNLFPYLLILFPSSPSGSDSGVRLCFLLALWFMAVMIYCLGELGSCFKFVSSSVFCLSLPSTLCGTAVELLQNTVPIMVLNPIFIVTHLWFEGHGAAVRTYQFVQLQHMCYWKIIVGAWWGHEMINEKRKKKKGCVIFFSLVYFLLCFICLNRTMEEEGKCLKCLWNNSWSQAKGIKPNQDPGVSSYKHTSTVLPLSPCRPPAISLFFPLSHAGSH